MRILQAMAGAPQGGAEAFFERLALAFARAGLDQSVLVRRDAGRRARLLAGGVAAGELPFGGLFDWRTRPAFRRIVAETSPDIVLTYMSRATAACPPGRNLGGNFLHLARLGGYYDLKYYRRCDHLIGNTRDIVRHIEAGGWPPGRVHYLPNFVDARRAPPEGRARHGTPEGAPLVLALGRLHPNKAFDVLIAALARLPGAYLWLAGAGALDAGLRRAAAEAGVAERVRFLGWRDDPAPLFAAADLVCVPSRREPLGNVVIEAWAQNKPVVAAASEGPRQLLTDGENGLLVPIDDAAALAAALGRVIASADLAARLRSGGTAAYEGGYTEAAVVGQYRALFERLLAPGATPS